MNILVLDDERTLHGTFEDPVFHFKTVEEAIEWLEQHLHEPFILFLDHDLGYTFEDKKLVAIDSRPFADYLMMEGFPDKTVAESDIYVHSMNVVGAEYLTKQLSSRFSVKRIPVPKELYVDYDKYEGLQRIDPDSYSGMHGLD